MNNFLLFRILGNDLNGIHGDNQTYNNLKYTLEYEPEFKNTDKIFLLNRIYNKKKKNLYINLLNKYKKKYIILDFDINKFKSIDLLDEDKIQNKDISKKLIQFNLYLINNNGARNFCINYGKQQNYRWIFPLDSNSYFTSKMFNDIINNIQHDTKYLIIPQVRLKNENLNNEFLIGKQTISFKKTFEPQIAFRNDCDILFNKDIPYGFSPKAELLRVLKVKGEWNNWGGVLTNNTGIKDRTSINVKTQTLSYVIRLNPFSSNNDINKNYYNRINGLKNLVDKIRNDNTIENYSNLENYSNKNKSDKMNKIYIFVILILILVIIFYLINF